MMDIRKIDDSISVSPQIEPGDLAELAAQGYRSIICNRPDGEEPGQPEHELVAAAARDAGLQFMTLPVYPGQLTAAVVAEFADAMERLPKPVLAYCRSGTRSVTAWALSQSGRQRRAKILEAARQAGYDLGGIAGALRDPD